MTIEEIRNLQAKVRENFIVSRQKNLTEAQAFFDSIAPYRAQYTDQLPPYAPTTAQEAFPSLVAEKFVKANYDQERAAFTAYVEAWKQIEQRVNKEAEEWLIQAEAASKSIG